MKRDLAAGEVYAMGIKQGLNLPNNWDAESASRSLDCSKGLGLLILEGRRLRWASQFLLALRSTAKTFSAFNQTFVVRKTGAEERTFYAYQSNDGFSTLLRDAHSAFSEGEIDGLSLVNVAEVAPRRRMLEQVKCPAGFFASHHGDGLRTAFSLIDDSAELSSSGDSDCGGFAVVEGPRARGKGREKLVLFVRHCNDADLLLANETVHEPVVAVPSAGFGAEFICDHFGNHDGVGNRQEYPGAEGASVEVD